MTPLHLDSHDFPLSLYSSTGLYRHPQVLPDHYLISCKKAILSSFNYFSPELFASFDYNSFECQSFHDALLNLRINNPHVFSAIYDSLQSSVALKRIACSNIISSIACKLLSCSPESLFLRNTIVRLDAPSDTRNNLDWHYDVYSTPEHYPEHGLTIVLPLTIYSDENGAPICCLGSHLFKSSQTISPSSHSFTSESFYFQPGFVDSFEQLTLTSPPGTVWAFPMPLIHKSGINHTSLFRISLLIRYYNSNSDSYVPLAQTFRPLLID
tara:strand:+ start:1165 stop:1968 length:804 start_codon:yes stop_codon:yes gene_type:complete